MNAKRSYRWLLLPVSFIVLIAVFFLFPRIRSALVHQDDAYEWQVPDSSRLAALPEAPLIRYGKELIVNTAHYLGPKGAIAPISNGMNCQNCHLEAGTKKWGNNYSAVFAIYPKFRERSGIVENIYKRVNDCIERSLNGKALDTNSREMQAITAYINWLGNSVPKNIKPGGAGITDISFLERPADTAKGSIVYLQKCQRCHGMEGKGIFTTDGIAYLYPPLWGDHSYSTGAGLFRISRFAGFVKDNMPFGCSHSASELTDEQAWDVAAFVNSRPRPAKDLTKDWPDMASKPIDHPFGPYADGFTETQHKFGPWQAIIKAKNKLKRSP